ncbi:MAG: aminoacyl-tRNA hydrolase [Halanaerobiaceae bacterium]|nr:aminoacyl-tRNA hydrolase [Halanaerobiaceae bacterium]
MFLIVGLGNPGPRYRLTRHNAGFMAVHKLAEDFNIKANSTKFQAIIGEGHIAGNKVILAQPLTYMNSSGIAVKQIVDYYKIERDKIIIIYDDLDLPPGKLRIKKKGSSGGHNGIASIIESLGTQEIPRIRIGIGSPPEDFSVIDYVLGHFTAEERAIIEETLNRISPVIEEIIQNGYQAAMSKYN